MTVVWLGLFSGTPGSGTRIYPWCMGWLFGIKKRKKKIKMLWNIRNYHQLSLFIYFLLAGHCAFEGRPCYNLVLRSGVLKQHRIAFHPGSWGHMCEEKVEQQYEQSHISAPSSRRQLFNGKFSFLWPDGKNIHNTLYMVSNKAGRMDCGTTKMAYYSY